MPRIDLRNKRFAIFGLQGSGKSVLAEYIASSIRDHVFYDPLDEHRSFNHYVPDDRQSVAELELFIEKYVMVKRPKLLIIDEANKYILPKPHPLPRGIDDLNDLSRHWDISWGCITRRPSQFHTDIVELCQYLFIFRMPGKNDLKFFESIERGLSDKVLSLPQFHFVVVQRDGMGRVTFHAPVPTTYRKPA